MASLFSWCREEWRTLLLVILGTAAQLLLVTRSLEFLIVHLLPDDAFYYFEIARNIAAGQGATFDGVNPTNGYHPLWLLALIPFFSSFSGGGTADIAPIHAVLVFTVALNAATACIVARIIARFSESKNIRALGLFIWLFNPYLLYETLNGLETSLSLFFFTLFFLLALRLEEKKSTNHVVLGVIAGAMMLARLDLALYVAVFLGWLWVRRGREGFRLALVAGITAAIVVAPWFVWSFANFGTPMTSSSVASTIVNHALIVQDHGESWFQTGKAVVYHSQYELDKLFERTGMYAIGCAIIGAAVALAVLRFFAFSQRLAFITVTQSLFVGCLLLFFANAGIRWTARSWYFVSANIFLAILVVMVIDVLVSRLSWKKAIIAVLFLVVAFSFFVNWSKVQRHGMPSQKEMYEATLWMNENLPEESIVGVFNAGIQGYFSRHTVINLDGLVNNAALEALKERKLWSYVSGSGIDYISDFPLYLTYRYKSFLDTGDVFDELELLRPGAFAIGLSIWRVR